MTIEVVANIPGDFWGPASRAYLFYEHTNLAKYWSAPMQVHIHKHA